MKKHYRLTIIDRDGDTHHYYFLSSNPWSITQYVATTIVTEGDFYGHKADMTMDILVHQMLMAPRNGIIEIELL